MKSQIAYIMVQLKFLSFLILWNLQMILKMFYHFNLVLGFNMLMYCPKYI